MNKLQRQIENAAYRTYNIASPNELKVGGKSFLDLPYNEKVYFTNGSYLVKLKHAEDINVYKMFIEYTNGEKLELVYDSSRATWVSIDWDFLVNNGGSK